MSSYLGLTLGNYFKYIDVYSKVLQSAKLKMQLCPKQPFQLPISLSTACKNFDSPSYKGP